MAKALFIFLLACLGGCSWVFFYPSRGLVHTPRDFGVEFHEISFPSLDGTRLVGWWLPAVGEEKGTVLFLHGNAENISTHVAAVLWLPQQGYTVFLFDYQGYGASEGSPGIEQVLNDIEAAFRYVLASRPNGFHLFGQSLGGSLAVLALEKSPEKEKIQSLALEGAFASFRGILADKLGDFWLLWPFQWIPGLFVFASPPVDVIPRLPPLPLLFIRGTGDPIVPPKHTKQLFNAAHEPKLLWTVEGGGHGDTFAAKEYRERFIAFLQAAGSPG